VNVKGVCKCRRIAMFNAANHCLVRLSVCLSVNCEPDGRRVEEGARGVREISRDMSGRAPVKAPANSVTLSKRALARQGKARQGNFSLRSINCPAHCCLQHPRRCSTTPPTPPSRPTCNCSRPTRYITLLWRQLPPSTQQPEDCRSHTSQHSHHARSFAPVSSP